MTIVQSKAPCEQSLISKGNEVSKMIPYNFTGTGESFGKEVFFDDNLAQPGCDFNCDLMNEFCNATISGANVTYDTQK